MGRRVCRIGEIRHPAWPMFSINAGQFLLAHCRDFADTLPTNHKPGCGSTDRSSPTSRPPPLRATRPAPREHCTACVRGDNPKTLATCTIGWRAYQRSEVKDNGNEQGLLPRFSQR